MKRILSRLLVLIVLLTAHAVCMAQQTTVSHIVDRGETLASIAARYHVTEAQIIELNPQAGQFIYVGMELTIPATTPQDYASNTPAQNPTSSNWTPDPGEEPNTRIDTDGNPVYFPQFWTIQYQFDDFDYIKESGAYGVGMVVSSISHWGGFHVGANLNFSINAGLNDPWGCIIEFGPSARIDISRNCFINIPVNVVCGVTFPEGSTDAKANWGGKVAANLYGFVSDRVGLFVGPQVSFGSGDSSVGLVGGLAFVF